MFQPESPEHRAYLQDIADKAFAQFKGVVAKGRTGRLKKPLAEIANGKIYVAEDAKTLGLIDDVGYLHDAWQHAATQRNLATLRQDGVTIDQVGIKATNENTLGRGVALLFVYSLGLGVP